MRRWLLVQMLVVAALVTAACSTNPPAQTRSPTPTLTPTAIPTPTPDEADDNAYYRCGGEVGYKLVRLTDEIGQTPLTDSIMCPAMQGWRETLEGIREQHSNCRTPASSDLLGAQKSVDSALESSAEALFYLNEYCLSPNGGEEYWDAALDAVLEGQFHLNECSRAFEAFIAGETEAPSRRHAVYTNSELRFAAEYPAGWEIEVTDNRNPLTGEPLEGKVVVFGPPDAQPRQRGIQVTVLRAAGGRRLSPEELPTDEGYIEYVKDWAEMMPVEIVVEPSIIEVDGYKAVEFVTSGTEEYEPYGLIGNVAIIVVEDRMFYIDAGGHAQGQDEMRSIYQHFMATFDLLPLP